MDATTEKGLVFVLCLLCGLIPALIIMGHIIGSLFDKHENDHDKEK